MAEKIEFELVSPEKLLMSESVDMITIPGSEGEFGVLHNHVPVISSLNPGVIRVWDGGEIKNAIFVAGGFAEVAGGHCTVLAEEAMPVSDIDAASVDQAIRDAKEDIEDAKDARARKKAELQLAVLKAKHKAATGSFAA